MKLTILASALADALAVAEKATAARSTLPALSHVLLDAQNGLLTITGTDLEFRAWKAASAKVETEGAVCVLPARVREFLDGIVPGDAIQIVAAENHRVTLTCGRASARLAGLPADEFPVLPSFDDPAADVMLSAATLAELIAGTAYAVAPDDSRPVLAGVSLVLADGVLTLAASDGFRLAIRQADVGAEGDLSLIVVGKRLAQVGGLLAKATSARLLVDAKQSSLLVESETGSWCVRLIEGQFPDWRRIVPTLDRVQTVVTVNRDALLRAGRLVKGVSEEDSRIVHLTAADGELTIRAADQSDQEAVGVVDAERVGADLTIKFNGRYLSDALAALDSESVTLELVKADSPGIVRAAGERNGNLSVVMPMSLARKP